MTRREWIATIVAGALVLFSMYMFAENRSTAERWGEDRRKLFVSDSTNKELRRDSIQHALRIGRLVVDSSLLADAAVKIRADFAREHQRWQSLIAGWQHLAGRIDTVLVAPSDSLPTLDAVIRQANATIASCRADTANCEARASNAEARRATADSLWRNAESRASQHQQQATIWRHRAQPSLWEQLKQIPGRVVTTTAIASAGYAACKLGGL